MQKWVIGVDEAGRGPLAGPVAVGVALVPNDFDWGLLPGVGDSKQVAPKKRELVFKRAEELKKTHQLDYAVFMVSAKAIDKLGVVVAINVAIARALKAITPPLSTLGRAPTNLSSYRVLLDGGLKAPAEFLHQATIIKGDAKEKVIGLASIMAKVTRDQYMERIALKTDFLPYNFAQHKGYGTKAHREAIAQNGMSLEHRVSYCKNIKLL